MTTVSGGSDSAAQTGVGTPSDAGRTPSTVAPARVGRFGEVRVAEVDGTPCRHWVDSGRRALVATAVLAAMGAGGVGLAPAEGAPVAQAACTVTWDGEAGDGLWETPRNWSGDALPGPDDDVCVAGGAAVTLSFGSAEVRSLTADGPLTVQRALLLAADSRVGGALTLDGIDARLVGAGTLTVAGPLIWMGGAMEGPGATHADGGLTVGGFGSKRLLGRTLTNRGVATWSGPSFLEVGAGAVIANLPGATFDLQGDPSLVWNSVGPLPAFDNAGALRKTAGTGTSLLGVRFSNQSTGVVEVQAGTLDVFGFGPAAGGGTQRGRFVTGPGAILSLRGGAYVLEAGTRFEGAGLTRLVDGEFTVAGDVPAGRLELASGTLTGPGTLAVGGLLTWSGGAMGGSGQTRADGGLLMGPTFGVTRVLDGRRLDNAGAATMTACCLSLSNGAVLTNLAGATFDGQGGAGISAGAGGPAPVLRNAGAFRASAGAGFAFFSVPFQNTGTVEVQAGTLDLGGGYVQTAGTTVLAGGRLASMSGAPVEIRGGTLAGSGTIDAAVLNAGRVAPGLSPGGLTLTRGYTQTADGVLSVELGGLTPGSQHDQLAVSGAAALAGTLEVRLLAPFVPAHGDRFQVLTFASPSGTFDAVAGADLGAGRSLVAEYGATAVTLVAVTPEIPPSPTATPTSTPTASPSPTASATASPSRSPTATPTATSTPTGTATATPAAPGPAIAAGGGVVDGQAGRAVFAFSVRRSGPGEAATGRLEYRSLASGLSVRSTSITAFEVAGDTARFGGTCVRVIERGGEAPCTFTATAVDGDGPGGDGRGDQLVIEVAGGGPEGGPLRSGSVEVVAGVLRTAPQR